MEIKNERAIIYPNKNAVLSADVLEPSTTGQQDAKDDLLGIEAPNDNKVNTLSLFIPTLMQFHPPEQIEVCWRHHMAPVAVLPFSYSTFCPSLLNTLHSFSIILSIN